MLSYAAVFITDTPLLITPIDGCSIIPRGRAVFDICAPNWTPLNISECEAIFRNDAAENRRIPALKQLISDAANKGEVFEYQRPIGTTKQIVEWGFQGYPDANVGEPHLPRLVDLLFIIDCKR